MNTKIAAAVTTIVAALGGGVWAQQPSVTLSPAALKEIAEVEAEIDASRHNPRAADRTARQVELAGGATAAQLRLVSFRWVPRVRPPSCARAPSRRSS
jgi:hypothetical protein